MPRIHIAGRIYAYHGFCGSPHYGLSMRAYIVAVGFLPLLSICALFSGCVSLRVEPLTHESYPSRGRVEPVQMLDAEPSAAHIKLARIIATSESADEDQMQEKILARAKTLGADAVVMGKFDILESMGSAPLYVSTLGPTADSFGSYSGGWGWWPFYYDPWSFVQGSADQIGRTEYLSGIAIRFTKES